MEKPPSPGPLAGLKVLELARVLAGPWAGQVLADLGADVIKVERPGTGDDTRPWGPPFVAAAGGGHLDSAYFHSTNRGKRSITLDLDSAEGQDAVRALAARSDILLENFKVGGLAKYGLDAASLTALNPRLIYCSVTGFGQTGPYAPRAGYDYMIQGMAGIMDITGEAQGVPVKMGVAFADIFTGLYSVIGILAAVERRHATGRGGVVDMALLDSQVGVLANQAMNYLVSGKAPKRMGNAHPNLVPYSVYPVSDGHVIIAVGNPAQWEKLCSILGLGEIAMHPDYATNAARVANRETLTPILDAATSRFARDDLLARCAAAFVPAGPINSIADVFADPQVIARGLRIDQPAVEAEGGSIPGVRTPIMIDGVPMTSGRPAPRLGEHNDAILATLRTTDRT
jgi:crotonobetainyl-CoA:carnitine CoA-transferase CaiB-like acyl-CoA transferase